MRTRTDPDNPRGLHPRELEWEKKLWGAIYGELKAANPNVDDLFLRKKAYRMAVRKMAKTKLEVAKEARQDLIRKAVRPYNKAMKGLDNPWQIQSDSLPEAVRKGIKQGFIAYDRDRAYRKAMKEGNRIVAKAIAEYKKAFEYLGEWVDV